MPDAGARTGDFHGQPTRRIASDHLWLDVLAAAGPRIVRLGLAGSAVNLLAETPDVGWETPHGRYQLFGGHRLWFAPEDPDLVAVPDAGGLSLAEEPGGLRLTGLVESPTGLQRSIVVSLIAGAPALELCHELRNVGARRIELAPWSITQLPLAGTVVLPQAAAVTGHAVRPNRFLVLWPYTSWDDPRIELHDGLIVVRGAAGPAFKVGYFNDAGWVGYLRDGTLLVRRFEPSPGRTHPDLGCNVETFCGSRFLELELLGPLTELEPDETAVLIERWEVRRIESDAAAADLRPLVEAIAAA